MLNKFNRTYGRYLRFIARTNIHTIWLSVATAIGQLAAPYIALVLLGHIINTVAAGHAATNLYWVIGTFTAIIAAMRVLVAYLSHRQRIAQLHLTNQINAQINAKWSRVSNTLFTDPKLRNLDSAVNQGFMYEGDFSTFLSQNLNALISLIFAFIIAGASLIAVLLSHGDTRTASINFVNGPLFPVVLLLIFVIPALVAYFGGRKSSAIRKAAVDVSVQMNKVINYFISNVFTEPRVGKSLRIYDRTAMLQSRMDSANTQNFKVNIHSLLQSQMFTAFSPATIALTTAGIYYLLSLKFLTGAITLGTIVTYAGFIVQLISAITTFSNQIATSAALNQTLSRCIDFLEMPDPGANGSLPIEKRRDNKYQLEFHDVSFKYPGAKEFALQHVNLKLAIGQRLALVGQNGSGKTTLIRLLTRLDQPTSGSITLNGIDIQKYDLHEYQQIFAAVFQDFKLFALPVVDNVAASAHPDRARVESALEIAGVAERVHRMNHGIDTPLTRELDETGEDVSGGEAQKIAIARAWYKDAPFIILDEPTAALDPISEYDIYQHLDDLIADKTAIYISHRMSSTRFAARIVVLDHGQIVQDGTHASLMAEAGVYRDLFNAQAQYYTKERIAKERKNADLVYE